MKAAFSSRSLLRSVLGACLFALWSTAGAQQTYPSKPIRLIVPLAPGGPSDILARLKSEGAEVFATPPDAAAAAIRKELDKWADVIRRTGIKVE